MDRNDVGEGLPCRSGQEEGPDCTEPQIEDSHYGLCLVHERLERGIRWREAMAQLRGAGIKPPLCDADGCEKYAQIEEYGFAGYCAEHEALPAFLPLMRMVLQCHADAATAGLEEDEAATDLGPDERCVMAQTTARILTAQLLECVRRIQEEEAARAKPVGSLLGVQPRT